MLTLQDLIQERDKLRELYLHSAGSDKKILAVRGKMLAWAIESKEKHQPDQVYFEEVKKAFGGQ